MDSITLSGGFTMTSSTIIVGRGGKKGEGFCDQHNIDHAWESGPTLTCNPPIATRACINCGKQQRLMPEQWVDAEPRESGSKD